MTNILLGIVVALLAGAIVLLILLLRKRVDVDLSGMVGRLESLERAQERSERALREEVARNREESGHGAAETRKELASSLKSANDTLVKNLTEISKSQHDRLEGFSSRIGELTKTMEARLETTRETVEKKLTALQTDNAKKLDEMRKTVDEKLQSTLEKRLGESFKLVSERLEQVHKGLGEVQELASGVGDLKKVLTNVKTRGTWGEIQLGNLLEQMLTPDQYAENYATGDGRERVEYVIRLPGRDTDDEVVLPIDAKFPLEDYQRLVDASEAADAAAVEEASKALETRVKACARDINSKYINPPRTTDFAILYLPTEGLYAEVLRRAGLASGIQQEFRVLIAGPTTLAALLNSLQMGFRTLAIEKRSSEVWDLLAVVKREFEKFDTVVAKVQKKLQEASNVMDAAARRTRVMGSKLKTIGTLPETDTQNLLTLPGTEDIDDETDEDEPPSGEAAGAV